jgi:putative ABC transport system permease protein
MLRDFRFALRMLRKNLVFSAIAVATLALGIGANTAIFSVVDHVILRPLAYRDEARLYAIHEVVPKFASLAPLLPVNAMHFLGWRKDARSFDDLALLSGMTMNLTGFGEPERLHAARVSANLFTMLGVGMQIGRAFLAEEDRPGRDRVVVLNDALWRRRFHSDARILGTRIALDGEPYEIIGVLPAGFRFPKLSQLYAMTVEEERPELWKPFAIRDGELDDMGDFNFACIARLKRGVSPSQALAELNVLQANFAQSLPEKVELRAAMTPLQEQITNRSKGGLEMVLAAVGAVLLIACVNIANLLLASATVRRREMAIRSAIGASAARLVRQMLVESLTLSCLGGALGIAVAFLSLRLIVAYAPVDLPRMDEVRLDPPVLLFTTTTAILCGLICGLIPAWLFGKADPQDAMRTGSRGSTAGRRTGLVRSALAGVEVALSALCLIAAGLLVHSFINLIRVDKGFEVQSIVTVALSLPDTRYPDLAKKAAFVRTIVERVESLPGVVSAGVSNMLPLAGEGGNNVIGLEGTSLPIMERPLADIRQVNRDYFRTMGIPLRSGRVFGDADRDRKVAMVSSLTAERFWPGQSPLGKRFRMGGDDTPLLEVTGVVGDVRGVSLNRAPSMTIYVPYWQRFWNQAALAVRTSMDPVSVSGSIRRAIRQADPQLPVPAFKTMDEIVSGAAEQRRFQMSLVLLFAVAALLLASLGIYGVISYSVAQRLNEMGIRMALGARRGHILGMVLRQGAMPSLIGLAAGVVASMAVNRALRSFLFGVSVVDPVTIGAVVLVLGVVSLAATYLPALRATRVDPAMALRWE